MATQTTNLGLVKPDYTDAADIAVINTNMDTIDAQERKLSDGLCYVVNGNTSIESATIPVGKYVRLVNSTIAGRSDGIYTVKTAIPVAPATIDNTYLNEAAPITGGVANDLNSKLRSTHYNLSDVATIGSGVNVSGDVFKAGNVVSLYIHGSGLATAQALGVLNSGFHPKTAYVIMPVFDSSSPYNPVVGSVWIHSNGRIEKYGSSGGEYAYGTFVVDE